MARRKLTAKARRDIGQEEHVARAICSCSDKVWRDLTLTDKKMLLEIARAAIRAMENYDA